MQNNRADGVLVIVTVLAAISWIFSKEAVLLMPPLFFMGLRFLLAAVLLVFIAKKELSLLDKSGYARSALVGLVFGVGMSLWVMGIAKGTHVGEGSFITSLAVIITPIIALILFKERPQKTTWLALPVAISGLALLSLKNGFRPEIGQLFYVAAALVFAFFYVLTSRVTNAQTRMSASGKVIHFSAIPPLALTTIMLFVVGVFTLSLSLLIEPWQSAVVDFSGEMLFWIFISALIGTSLRFWLQTYAQSLSVSANSIVILVLEPVWVAIFAIVWFGETMSVIQIMGCILIFCALLINRAGAVKGLFQQLSRR